MRFTYLAVPYTPLFATSEHMGRIIREDRYHAACRAAAALMRSGRVVFSPISHSHGIDLFIPGRGDGDFWQRQDAPYLKMASELVVLELPGWTASRGVAHEIAVAERRGIPVRYMSPSDEPLPADRADGAPWRAP